MKIKNIWRPPVLETERLILRPIELTDADDIFEYAKDAETTKYMLWDTHKSIDDTLDFINWTIKNYDEQSNYDYAFVLKDGNKVIGTGGAFVVDKLPHSAEIGYIINKNYWGKGYVPEAMNAFIKHLFENLNVHRVEAKHFAENPNSGKVMKKLGMEYEGRSRDYVYVKGKYWSCDRYSIINKKN